MFSELNSLVDFSDKSPPENCMHNEVWGCAEIYPRSVLMLHQRKFILLSDSQNDGSFLVHHFLAMYIKGGFRVCFLALVQSFSHYNNVAQKLGVNLSSACDKGQVTFVNGLALLCEALMGKTCYTKSNELTVNGSATCNPFSGLRTSGFTLQLLYNNIKLSLEGDKKPCLLLIDDMTSLLSVGIPVQQVSDFAHYCCRLMCHTPSGLNGCLVTLVHNDSDVDDEESLLLWKQLLYSAHMELHVRGLSSGYSREVHGQLSITSRDPENMKFQTKDVQYKMQDRSVTFFAPGMSKAVL